MIDRSQLFRDREGRAKTYTDPERAERDAERLRAQRPELCVWIKWVPMPRRPWRVAYEEVIL